MIFFEFGPANQDETAFKDKTICAILVECIMRNDSVFFFNLGQ